MAVRQPSGFMTRELSGTVERPTNKTVEDVLEKLDESKGDIAKGAAEFIPGVGEAMAVKRVSDAMDEKDYTGAAIETAAGALGLVPAVGDMAGKGLRAFKKADPLEIGINPATEGGVLLKKYDENTSISIKEKSKNATAGSKEANKLIDAPVKEGSKVGIRLNLNSSIPDMPKGLDKLQTIHKNNYNGKALSYQPIATVEDVKFNVSQKGRQGIASRIKGVDVPEAKSKFPAMSVDGNFNPNRNVLNEIDEDVVEIGFNPASGHLFIDMSTGQAVKGADVATVVGDRVYAKGVKYMKKSEAPQPLKASDGTELPSEVRYRMKKGGAVPMEKQMSMFDDGGLIDEGGTVDPISGNEVPVGSTQKEVRDDIPAQLSEGEFVFPADVVRYIGLEKLMQMRQEAKRGLAMMDKMGQMGNNDEAVIPDTIPFELSDLDMEDDPVEMQQGGTLLTNPDGTPRTLTPEEISKGFDDFLEKEKQLNFYDRQREPVSEEKSGLLDPVKSKVDSDILTRDVEQDDISNLPKTYTPATQQDVPMQPDYSGLTYKDVMPEITPSYFKTGERSYRPATSTATPETVTPTTSTPSEPAPTIEEQDILYEPPAPEVPPTTPSGLTPDDPESPFDLEATSGYKGDTVQEQQMTSDEQMADLFEGPTQAEQDAQELIQIDPVRDEVFNQFNNLGDVDKSRIYDAYGIEQGNFEGLLNKAGTNFLKQFTTSIIGGTVGGIPGLIAGSQVGKLFEDKDDDKPKEPVLTDTQNLNRERAAMALGIEMTGKVGHGKGDIDPITGYVYNRYGVPINPSTGDALNKIKFSDLDSLTKSLQANGKSGWQGGYIGTKDSNRYKNLNDVQRARYDKYIEELDKLYGFTDEPATYATTQQIAGRPLDVDDADSGGKPPPPEFTTPATYDQRMQELDDEDADITDDISPDGTGVDIFGNVVLNATDPSIKPTLEYDTRLQELTDEDADTGEISDRDRQRMNMESETKRMLAQAAQVKQVRIDDIKNDLQNAIDTAGLTGQQLDNFLDDVINQEQGTTTGLGKDGKTVVYRPENNKDTATNYQTAAKALKEEIEAKRKAEADAQAEIARIKKLEAKRKAEAKKKAEAKAKAARDKARRQSAKDKKEAAKRAKAVAKSRASEAKGGRRRTYARGFREGGLASRSSK